MFLSTRIPPGAVLYHLRDNTGYFIEPKPALKDEQTVQLDYLRELTDQQWINLALEISDEYNFYESYQDHLGRKAIRAVIAKEDENKNKYDMFWTCPSSYCPEGRVVTGGIRITTLPIYSSYCQGYIDQNITYALPGDEFIGGRP